METRMKTETEREVEQYNKDHEALMIKWEAKHKEDGHTAFVKDGVVCPEIWFSQSQRILYILKEAYNKDGSDDCWNLPDYLKENSKGRTWNAVAEWQYALEKTTKDNIPVFDNWLGCPVGDMEKYNAAKCELLKRCAVINIKKSNGKSGSFDDDLSEYVKRDWKSLKDQIEIIKPTIVVFGNTFHVIMDCENNKKPKCGRIFNINISDKHEGHCCYKDNGKILIPYYHPANRFSAVYNFNGISAMYHNFLKDNADNV